jgi:Aminotransferase class-III
MIMLGHVDLPVGPPVTGLCPGPRSAELLISQGRRESNARVHPHHISIAIDEAWGSFVRDLDGNVFIDFPSGAGALSPGHNHPELVRVVTEQLSRFGHGLDLPTPAKDAFTEARLSMLPPAIRSRTRPIDNGVPRVNSTKGDASPGIPWRRNPRRRYAGPRPVSTRRRAEAFHHRPVTLLLTQGPR